MAYWVLHEKLSLWPPWVLFLEKQELLNSQDAMKTQRNMRMNTLYRWGKILRIHCKLHLVTGDIIPDPTNSQTPATVQITLSTTHPKRKKLFPANPTPPRTPPPHPSPQWHPSTEFPADSKLSCTTFKGKAATTLVWKCGTFYFACLLHTEVDAISCFWFLWKTISWFKIKVPSLHPTHYWCGPWFIADCPCKKFSLFLCFDCVFPLNVAPGG